MLRDHFDDMKRNEGVVPIRRTLEEVGSLFCRT